MHGETDMTPREALPQMTEILNSGGSFRLMVTGNSMLPFLRHRQDRVILAPVSHPIRRGDILFYLRGPEQCILHRVHTVRPDGTLMMCGDSQVALEPIRAEQVLARATHVERNGKQIPCSRLSLRMVCGLWIALRPVRPYLLAMLRKLHLVSFAVLD